MPPSRPTLAALIALGALLALPGCRSREQAEMPEPTAEAPAPPSPGDASIHAARLGIADAGDVARRIMEAARGDHHAWERLAEMCDSFGARPAGSRALEQALAWSVEQMRADGLDRAWLDPVEVPVWERGEESATLLEPNGPRKLAMIGIGRSVGTPERGITAPVVLVNDFDQLDALGDAVRGKIVLYHNVMKDQENMFQAYGDAVVYRGRGAHRAAEHGAVAALIHSLTTRSLRTPHTGAMWPDSAPIPEAALAIEDAAMIERLIAGGEEVRVNLRMGARWLAPRMSANAIGELRGRERPDEIVVIGGHIDSWDVGTGAHDDGAGVVMVMEAARILKQLGLVPRRTVRVVLFTNEERGLDGGNAYRDKYKDDLGHHVVAMESDAGGARPLGFGLSGNPADMERLRPLLGLFAPVGELRLVDRGGGADIGPMMREGAVPGIGFMPDSTHYFDFHHTEADTVDKVDRDDYRDSVAAFTLMTWLLAEMEEPLARRPPDAATEE